MMSERCGALPKWPLAMRAWLLAQVLSCTLLGVSSPAAADPPRDVVPASKTPLTIPEPPKDFMVEHVGGTTWDYHPSSASLVRELKQELPRAMRSIGREL